MICATEGEMSQVCNFLDSCRTKYLWAKVRDAVANTLDSITLADLLKESTEDADLHFIALSDIHVGIESADFSLDAHSEMPYN